MTLCCSGCGNLDRPDIAAFLRGETHEKPKDLDYRKECYGRALWVDIRRRKYRQVIRSNPDEAVLWPEFGDIAAKQQRHLDDLTERLVSRFSELLHVVEGFWQFCADRPLQTETPSTIRARQRFRGQIVRPYQARLVREFIGHYGSERMCQVVQTYGIELPWWDAPIARQEAAQPIAA